MSHVRSLDKTSEFHYKLTIVIKCANINISNFKYKNMTKIRPTIDTRESTNLPLGRQLSERELAARARLASEPVRILVPGLGVYVGDPLDQAAYERWGNRRTAELNQRIDSRETTEARNRLTGALSKAIGTVVLDAALPMRSGAKERKPEQYVSRPVIRTIAGSLTAAALFNPAYGIARHAPGVEHVEQLAENVYTSIMDGEKPAASMESIQFDATGKDGHMITVTARTPSSVKHSRSAKGGV